MCRMERKDRQVHKEADRSTAAMHKCAASHIVGKANAITDNHRGASIKQYGCYTFIISNISDAQPLQMEETACNSLNLVIAASVWNILNL